MKINFKKVSAVLASGLMAVSGIGFAAAANYPAPFVSSGAANAAVVYGTGAGVSSIDSVEAANIQLDLKSKTTGSVSRPTDQFVKIEKTSTKFQMGYGVQDVVSTAISNDAPGDGLPVLLADGVYVDNDNDEFDYTQKIDMANLYINMWADNDYAINGEEQGNNPTVGIKINSSTNVMNYTLDFTDEPLWSDLTSTDIEIMGKNYFILSYTNGTKLTLLDSAETTTLAEGESTTAAGHEVSISFIGSSSVKFEVDGVLTNTLSAGETTKIVGDDYIGVKEINTQDYAGGIKNVEFSIGSGKLELTTGSDVKINDATITGLVATLNHSGSSTGDKLSAIKIRWDADDDLFITPEQALTMPGFESIKLSFTGMVYDVEEVIKVVPGGDEYIMLDDFPMTSTTTDINLLYTGDSGVNYTGIGKDASNILRTTNNTKLTFDKDTDAYFVVTWNDTSSAESYLVRFTSFAKDGTTQKNTTTVQWNQDGSWVDKKTLAENADVIAFGSAEITLSQTDYALKTVNVTAGTGVSFNTLYSKEGLRIILPEINETAAVDMSVNPGSLNTSASGTYQLMFAEEDKSGNLGGGDKFNVTLGFEGTTPKTSVTDVVGEDVGFDEIKSTDVERSFMYSALATEMLWNKPTGADSIEIIYHGNEAYGEFYVTAPGASTSTSGDVMYVTDKEVSSVSSKNLIVVGGSCINSAAASLVGGAYCGDSWATTTGVGSGQFLIKGYASSTLTSELALLVAGYDAADTQNAATYLRNKVVDTSKEYKGTSSTTATLVTETE